MRTPCDCHATIEELLAALEQIAPVTDEFGPIDLDALYSSPRAGDRLTWHLATCTECTMLFYCALGTALETEALAWLAAVAAFRRVPPDQRRILIDELKDLAMEDCG